MAKKEPTAVDMLIGATAIAAAVFWYMGYQHPAIVGPISLVLFAIGALVIVGRISVNSASLGALQSRKKTIAAACFVTGCYGVIGPIVSIKENAGGIVHKWTVPGLIKNGKYDEAVSALKETGNHSSPELKSMLREAVLGKVKEFKQQGKYEESHNWIKDNVNDSDVSDISKEAYESYQDAMRYREYVNAKGGYVPRNLVKACDDILSDKSSAQGLVKIAASEIDGARAKAKELETKAALQSIVDTAERYLASNIRGNTEGVFNFGGFENSPRIIGNVDTMAPGTYRVVGLVKGKNAFNAEIKKNITVIVEWDGSNAKAITMQE